LGWAGYDLVLFQLKLSQCKLEHYLMQLNLNLYINPAKWHESTCKMGKMLIDREKSIYEIETLQSHALLSRKLTPLIQ
jgi:hypothetical protein